MEMVGLVFLVVLFFPFSFSGKVMGAGKVTHCLTTHANTHALVHTFCCCLPNPDGPSCSLHRGLKENHSRQLIAWQASASARQRAELMMSQSRCVFACVCVLSSTVSVFRHKPSILNVELL